MTPRDSPIRAEQLLQEHLNLQAEEEKSHQLEVANVLRVFCLVLHHAR